MTLIDFVAERTRRTILNPAKSRRFRTWTSPRGFEVRVTEAEALSLSTYYAGVTLIGATLAALPLHVYKDETDEEGRVVKRRVSGRDAEETKYLLYPNPEQTRMAFFERVAGDEVAKAAFIFVVKTADGTPAELWHVERHRIRVDRTESGRKVYWLDGTVPLYDYSEGGEIVHIPNWGKGIDGWDIVEGGAQTFSLGLTAERFAQKAFEQGLLPPGIINVEGTMKDGQAEAVREEWFRMHRGTDALKIAVLQNGKFQQLSSDPEKLQMAEVRKYQAGDIATLLGVPPHMVGLVDKTSSWGAGIAEQTAGFATFTLSRHIARFEQAINKTLLVTELTGRYCQFDLRGLLRGTTLQRYQAHSMGYGRWLTVNEIRAIEDLPPVAGGDTVLAQLNLTTLDELQAYGALPSAGDTSGDTPPADSSGPD